MFTMRGSRSSLQLQRPGAGPLTRRHDRTPLRVMGAITKQKKEAIVEAVKTKLQSSVLVFGMRTEGLNVQQMEELRQSFPAEHASVYVCKNSLMKVAIDQLKEWKELRPIAKKQNAWIFVDEDGIAETVKAWLQFEEKETQTLKEMAAKGEEVSNATEIYGGSFNGQLCTPEEIAKLKDLPSKKEVQATVAGLLNSKLAELDEDKTRTVKEFLKEEDSTDASEA